MADRMCAVPICVNLAEIRDWCRPHYARWRRTGDVGADKPIKAIRMPGTPLEDRFWPHVDKRGSEECWPWTGRRTRKGYPTIGKLLPDGRWVSVFVYAVAYEMEHGPVPDGLQIDHTCHNRDPDCPGGNSCEHRVCVNPAHLEAVTGKTNTQRAHRRKLSTHCPKGHEFTPENTYYRPNGGRRCRACLLEARHAAFQKQWKLGLTATGQERVLPPRSLVQRALEAEANGRISRQPSEIPQRHRRHGPQPVP
jgi:hypothetical protein